ncbi:maleylacetate reductase [Rhodococcus qingshengii]|uniref:maleylacetate reductase n=1 Tax=Rhodococcus qingshengii TaxID=334542 RepID=UPI001BE5563D|nr:maleylacetate reductase [Rhodococcus qingshengii]MBT2269954.1 maleylacetate reductase [Rhodococcus qingshengii]
MTFDFVYEAMPMRVRFGVGAVSLLTEEIERLSLSNVLVLCGPHQRAIAERIVTELGERAAGLFSEARMHVPAEVAWAAVSYAARLKADGFVAIGGGSAIGVGKAVALELGSKLVAVPTTYAGSEMTPIWGITEGNVKRTGRDRRALPSAVVYDPELTTSMPVELSVTSACNAMAHAIEALYAPDTSPIISLMAEEGIRSFISAVPEIIADTGALQPRSGGLYGAWLCGATLGATTMSLHHQLCHVLGGRFDLSHAAVHTVVLPHVLAFNEVAAPEARTAIGRAMQTEEDPAIRLWQLISEWNAPRSLREIGLLRKDLPAVADAVLAAPYANPRQVERTDLLNLLARAWAGEQPSSDQE